MPQCAVAMCRLKEQCPRVSYNQKESICYNLIGHFKDDHEGEKQTKACQNH